MSSFRAYKYLDGSPGEWWAPGSDVRIAGSLSRKTDNGGWELRILGDLNSEYEIARVSGVGTNATLHGISPLGPVTAFGAEMTGGWREFRDSTSSSQQRRVEVVWFFTELYVGGHFMPDQQWGRAAFELPGFAQWISGFGYELEGDLAASGSTTAQIPGGSVTAWWRDIHASETKALKVEGYGGYVLHSESGMSLARIDMITQALRNLNNIMCSSFASPIEFTLLPHPSESDTPVQRLRGQVTQHQDSGHLTAFLSIRDIDFTTFIPKWIEIHEIASIWPTFGPHPESAGYIETEFVTAVNEAESLAKIFGVTRDSPSQNEKAILTAIQDVLNKEQQSRVRMALDQARNRLADVLGALVDSATPAFYEDFFRDPKAWGRVVSKARHALSHGLDPETYPSEAKNPQALMHLTTTVQAVKKLAALHAAGYEYEGPTEVDHSFNQRFDTVRFRNSNSALGEEVSIVGYASPIWAQPRWTNDTPPKV
ncbi:ApeA N-terminal domain 1-containing protein [Micrococcus luteus]|uniref:ApeA N-terminal domain 1-containing protein n=1 Tax=Micrococcus luteus TaxID=1270 RepID=UPI0037F86A07